MTPLSDEREPWRSPELGNPCKGVARNPEDGREHFFDEAEIALARRSLFSMPILWGQMRSPFSRRVLLWSQRIWR